MDLRSCDVCGALADANAIELGRGSLNVLRRRIDPMAQFFGGGREQACDSFDLCVDCTTQFVALIEARKAQRI